ncbi:hypothetical protein G5V59_08880 [Nocardioides sp. W3-2-3]|nr:hypothetical protein [Nocardioides convexus]
MTRAPHRTRLLVVGGVVASALPLVGPPGQSAQAADSAPAYGGFTAAASSTPVRIEVFEPSLPIPVDAGKAQAGVRPRLQPGEVRLRAVDRAGQPVLAGRPDRRGPEDLRRAGSACRPRRSPRTATRCR